MDLQDMRIALIGGIHGGYEFNTVLLSQLLIDHFDHNPFDVLPGVSLIIIPMANPDGVTRGGGWCYGEIPAEVAEQADATVSKTVPWQRGCRFESDLRHYVLRSSCKIRAAQVSCMYFSTRSPHF